MEGNGAETVSCRKIDRVLQICNRGCTAFCMFRLRFTFKNKKYDKSRKYFLVAYDDKNDLEILRHEIMMDIAFADDFGFNL